MLIFNKTKTRDGTENLLHDNELDFACQHFLTFCNEEVEVNTGIILTRILRNACTGIKLNATHIQCKNVVLNAFRNLRKISFQLFSPPRRRKAL